MEVQKYQTCTIILIKTNNLTNCERFIFRKVVIPVEPTSIFDPLGKWEDHEACWMMQYRGTLGETLLHLLIICDTRLTTRLARILLRCYPKLAVDVVEGEEYLGGIHNYNFKIKLHCL